MADLLRKIEVRGGSRPLQYAVRDVRGVEPLSAAPADRSGFNEEAEWTERAEGVFRGEHTETGGHVGCKFPLGWIRIDIKIDNVTHLPYPVIHSDSRIGDRGPHGESPLGTVTDNAPGEYVLTLYEPCEPVAFASERNDPLVVRQVAPDTFEIEVFNFHDATTRLHAACVFTLFPE